MAYSAGIFVLRSRLKEVKTEENSTCFGCVLSFLLHSTPLWLSYIIVGTDYMSLLFSLSCIDISCKLCMFYTVFSLFLKPVYRLSHVHPIELGLVSFVCSYRIV